MDIRKLWAQAFGNLRSLQRDCEEEIQSLRQYTATLEDENWELFRGQQKHGERLASIRDTTGGWLEQQRAGERPDPTWIVEWINAMATAALEQPESTGIVHNGTVAVGLQTGGTDDQEQQRGDPMD